MPFESLYPEFFLHGDGHRACLHRQALGGLSVGDVGAEESAGRAPERRFPGGHPGDEVGHPRQRRQLDPCYPPERGTDDIEQRAQDPGACNLEAPLEVRLRKPPFLGNAWEVQQEGPVKKVGTDGELCDPIQEHRTLGIEEDFLLVAIKLASGEGAPGREPAESGPETDGER